MKSTGIVRNIDSLGRIVIPKELRDSMNINSQDKVEIFVDNNDIVIKKFKKTCVFCGSNENVINLKNKNICEECLKNINKAAEKYKNDKEDKPKGVDKNEESTKTEEESNFNTQKDDKLFDKIINFFKNK